MKLEVFQTFKPIDPKLFLSLEVRDDGDRVVLLATNEKGDQASIAEVCVIDGMLELRRTVHYNAFAGLPIRHFSYPSNLAHPNNFASEICMREERE